ncbi:MAG: T9SS type A sorting domain-containing protein [Bacteroidia bacterium]|nr:MAG: T9SS type A sorting domain-containing protein [Bacteroidia bacterium]
MKKIYLLLFLSCIGSISYGQSTPQLSARSQAFRYQLEHSSNVHLPIEGYAYRKLADGNLYTSALIKVGQAALAERSLLKLGVKIGTKAGDIWTVWVPVSNMLSFFSTAGIIAIEVDQPAFPELDIARKKTNVDSVHAGISLPMPFAGKGVISGIIDFGFDYLHPAFYDTLGKAYRIRKVWELAATGTPPTGYSYGHEITDSTLLRLRGTDNTVQNHGTSVAALVGGSGVGGDTTGRKYRGIAYESDLVFVGVRRDTLGNQWMHGTFTDFVDGINYIFTYAASVGKPAVVNISWGSQSGAHDGTSLFNQACNNLSGPGKIVVMSAGNEGGNRIHLNKTFTANDTTVSSFITFSDTSYQRTWIDAWGEPGKTFCAAVSLYQGGVVANTTGFICIDNNPHSFYLLSRNGLDTCYIEMTSSASEINNGKPHIFLNVFNKSSDSMVVRFKANNGTINAWNESYFYGYVKRYSSEFESYFIPGMTNGNTNSTVSEMGSGDSVLLVGAYISNNTWTNINGASYNVSGFKDKIAGFSSRGPYIDGRIKPDITAPGLVVATASSSFDSSYYPFGTSGAYVMTDYVDPTTGRTFYYSQFSGTSCSAPITSGIIALLLQAVPTASVATIKSIVAQTAITDIHTGTIPAAGNNTWGHGKINAYQALRKLIQQTSVSTIEGKALDVVLYPNPNQGQFSLDYNSLQNELVTVHVYDMMGKNVYQNNWKVTTGNNQTSIVLPTVSKGNYLVKVSAKTGSRTITLSIQ